MKLGFVSAILDGWSFEEMIDTARDLGFSCVEAACWPSGKAERRYAGVSHIDVDGLTDEKAAYILGYCKERGVELSSLAFYPNTMDEDLEKRAANIAHLKKVILASEKLGVGMVTTFVGRATHKTVEENLELFREIWPPIVALCRGTPRQGGHRELPHVVRRHQLARRPEPLHHPRHLAQVL